MPGALALAPYLGHKSDSALARFDWWTAVEPASSNKILPKTMHMEDDQEAYEKQLAKSVTLVSYRETAKSSSDRVLVLQTVPAARNGNVMAPGKPNLSRSFLGPNWETKCLFTVG